MEIEFRKAKTADAEVLIDIYNAAFYSDYVRYGECPAYGRTVEMMKQSILNYPKFLIVCDDKPVGCISCKALEKGSELQPWNSPNHIIRTGTDSHW